MQLKVPSRKGRADVEFQKHRLFKYIVQILKAQIPVLRPEAYSYPGLGKARIWDDPLWRDSELRYAILYICHHPYVD
jgi:hypothetical protein